MEFKIPFTFAKKDILKKRAKPFQKYIRYRGKSYLSEILNSCDVDLNRREYLAICIRSFIFSFLFLYIVSTTLLGLLSVRHYFLIGLGIALMFSFFILFSQLVYPRVFLERRQRDIEKNLLPALEDIVVQLNSGIPLFSVLVNISYSGYGELSSEFKKAVKRINAGAPEQKVLSDISKKNPSQFFKRTLWQISNGLNAGSDMTQVVRDSIKSLNEEQMIQIQSYGNKLNPLMVFYMLAAVIVPSLSIAFLTIFSSMVNLPETTTKVFFGALFIAVVFIQIMFLGLIKSRRPSLL
ncbi:type II secretion system F family protein [Candidatus Pacearchaeota archaeon]|nr:MAG: type II secretion system F family protein [Candidatus Pacearchaeota archaeon]